MCQKKSCWNSKKSAKEMTSESYLWDLRRWTKKNLFYWRLIIRCFEVLMEKHWQKCIDLSSLEGKVSAWAVMPTAYASGWTLMSCFPQCLWLYVLCQRERLANFIDLDFRGLNKNVRASYVISFGKSWDFTRFQQPLRPLRPSWKVT